MTLAGFAWANATRSVLLLAAFHAAAPSLWSQSGAAASRRPASGVVRSAPSLDHPLDAGGAALDSLLRDARIVLLGENGHGVAEFSHLKAQLVRQLHERYGFDWIVFESGAFECDAAARRVGEQPAAATLLQCLRFPFEHTELLPLFEYVRATAAGARPLRLAGMDIQSQGFDSRPRPGLSAARLVARDPELARRIARADTALFLHPDDGGLGDAAAAYAHRHRDALIHDYRRAARLTEGADRVTFALSEGWVERLALRGGAQSGTGLPARYYELRDEWMARAVRAFADSVAGPRRVIVWLHNDHARYGRFPVGTDSIRSTGGFLREWYGDGVVSLGFLLGRGEIADNARRPRRVVPPPEGSIEGFLAGDGAFRYVVLRGTRDPAFRAWAAQEHPYLRMGLDTLSMTPGREFDALVLVDSVSSPHYVRP
jgi:erythromycin esterase